MGWEKRRLGKRLRMDSHLSDAVRQKQNQIYPLCFQESELKPIGKINK